MKKIPKLIVALLICFSLAAGAFSEAFASDSTPDESGEVIRVTLEDIIEKSFVSAVQSALNRARDTSDEEHIARVEVEPGEYELDRVLRIFSNTTLSLKGVTMKRATAANMLRVGVEDGINEGVVGYAYKNITIEGGTFDADYTAQTMIKVAHTSNFSMFGVTVKNLRNYHMLEAAGVDGFTLKGCSFENQILDSEGNDEICYEAVQLDVLKNGHIVNCRSEDLPIKNVLVEDCVFDNCPRGVGSHTSILNNPFDNIVIKNNTFTNMTSIAVQTLNWTNCKITGNYIENTPRGIGVYQVSSKGKGTFFASEIAEEGGTEAHVSDEYTPPDNSNTLISDNVIKNCGTVEDKFASYAVSGISVIGHDLSNPEEDDDEEDGDTIRLPKGNYYMNGVTIRNNYVDVKGSGCRLDNVRNAEVDSNVFYCGDNSFKPDSRYYGIFTRYGSQIGYIKNNYIKDSKYNAVHIGERCNVTSICDNEIDTASNYGIVAYNSQVVSILDNRIKNAATAGIGVNDASVISYAVARNRVTSCAVGINITKNSQATLNCNTLKCAEPMKYKQQSFLVTICNSFTDTADENGLYTGIKSLELSKGRCYRLNTISSPLNSFPELEYTSSDENVAEVGADGMIIAKGEGEARITVASSSGAETFVDVRVNNEAFETKTESENIITMVNSAFNNYRSATLSWEKVDGASVYHVFRRSTGGWLKIGETSETTYVDKTVVSGGAYYFTVRAVGADGEYIGAYDTTGTPLTYVAPPEIREVRNTSGNIKLTWNAVPGAAKYRLFYRYQSTGWFPFGSTAKTTKTLKNVVSGYTYNFIIRSIDAKGNPLNYYYKTGWTRMHLSKPKLKNTISGKKIKFKWDKVAGAYKYILMGKYDGKWRTIKSVKSNSCTYKASFDKAYTFTLRCLDKSLKHSSEYSGYNKVKIKKPKPKKKAKKSSKKTTSKASKKKK